MGLNHVEVPKIFRVNLQLLKFQLPLRRSYLHLKKKIVIKVFNLTDSRQFTMSPAATKRRLTTFES